MSENKQNNDAEELIAQLEAESSKNNDTDDIKTDELDELTVANFRIEELETELVAANSKVNEQKDSVIRAAAEVENVRRRAALDVEKAHKFALDKFANELLPVLDNFERAIATGNTSEKTSALLEGVELTYKSLQGTLTKFGISCIDPIGEPFDPELHQAMGMQVSDEPTNTVIMVMQKGYKLNDRLLRPAMVMVSKGDDQPVINTEA